MLVDQSIKRKQAQTSANKRKQAQTSANKRQQSTRINKRPN
jgi:hypothetical protein